MHASFKIVEYQVDRMRGAKQRGQRMPDKRVLSERGGKQRSADRSGGGGVGGQPKHRRIGGRSGLKGQQSNKGVETGTGGIFVEG